MNWISLSLLAPLFWAGSNFVDKYILGKYSKSIADFIFFSTITCWLFVIVLFGFFGMPDIDLYSLFPIATGMILIYSYGFYAKALEASDTSVLVILFKLIPVFTVVLAFLFLDQTLAVDQVLAFIIVLFGAVIVSYEPSKKIFTPGFGMIVIAILMWSVMTLMIDFGLTKMSFWHYFMLDNFGSGIAGLTLFVPKKIRTQVISGIKDAKIGKISWFSINNILDSLGQLTIKKALALGPSAGLVTVLMQVQSLYAIGIGVMLTLLVPRVIHEDISLRAMIKKIIGATIMFIGIYILIL